MSLIELRGVTKTFASGAESVTPVQDLDFTVEQGEFVCLMGPSGSGKTTLLHMLAGIDRPTAGTVKVSGEEVSAMTPSQLAKWRTRAIGYVFQQYNLIPVLTAKENVEFIMHLQGRNKTERDTRTLELLKAVGLSGMENRRPSKLSGGQQQRVAVARALASKPKFVLADEPTANLDSHSTENLLDIMEKLNKEEKITFIFSTHDQRVVNKARRVITLEDGKIISDIQK